MPGVLLSKEEIGSASNLSGSQYVVYYQFPIFEERGGLYAFTNNRFSGKIIDRKSGSMTVSAERWNAVKEGDVCTVLYDENIPERSIIYDFSGCKALISAD